MLTFVRDRRGAITAMEMSSPGDFIRYERVP